MKAVVYRGINDLRLEDVPEPTIESPTDALIKVTLTSICGSDLHVMEMGAHEPGKILGHEYCGVVEDIGNEVHNLKKGDRVVGKPFFNCGRCFYCKHHPDQASLCESGGLIGAMGNQGVQAEYARIPYAENTLIKILDDLSDEDVLFTGDVLSTGFSGIQRGRVGPGDTVAVFGCGPVGLCAVACAHLFGVSQVIGVDIQDYRLSVAQKFGAVTINASREDPVAKIKELTNGRGADAGIEAAGFEPTFRTCIQSTRRGGAVAVLGVFVQPTFFNIVERLVDIFTLTIGLGNLMHMEALIKLIQKGKLDLSPLITHRLPLSEAPRGYEIFEKKLENCIKVLLKP